MLMKDSSKPSSSKQYYTMVNYQLLNGCFTLFLAVVIPEGLNFNSSFITDTLPFIAAIWTHVLPSYGIRKRKKVTNTFFIVGQSRSLNHVEINK